MKDDRSHQGGVLGWFLPSNETKANPDCLEGTSRQINCNFTRVKGQYYLSWQLLLGVHG